MKFVRKVNFVQTGSKVPAKLGVNAGTDLTLS